MAANNIITLTLKDSASTSIDINTGDIVSFIGVSSDADSKVDVITKNQGAKSLLVDETPTQIVALSNDFISVTLLSDSTVTYFANAERVRRTYATAASGCDITLDDNSSAWSIVQVTETQAVVQGLVDAAAGSEQAGAPLGTVGTNVTQVQTGSDRDVTVVLTLTAASLGAPGAGTNEAVGALVYTFPAGSHVHTATFMSVGLTVGTVTTDTPDVGIGSIIGTGAVAVLGGTATFEDYITGQTATDAAGTATVKTTVATAGALTGISINEAAGTKTLHINAADGWNAGITGNLTATGTITLMFTKMS